MKALAERIFYEISGAGSTNLPARSQIRASYLDGNLLDSIIATVQRHGVTCREKAEKESLQKELAELGLCRHSRRRRAHPLHVEPEERH
jgi:hypothetical protein